MAEIKQEFGTDSYVTALKLKRKSQAEAFNNYTWRRWLDECSWLERDSPSGTIGLCKYCAVRLNVEFSYLRQRHQESGQHKERAKKHAQFYEGKTDEVNDDANEGDVVANDTSDRPEASDADEQEEQEGQEEQEEQASKRHVTTVIDIFHNICKYFGHY